MPDVSAMYEHFAVPAFAFQWATDLVQDYVEPGDRVLDAGCGTGIVARCARHRMRLRGQVVGIDIDEDKIEMARLCEPVAVEWRVANVTRMPFDYGWFDVVLCQQALQHFVDKLGALKEMRRVLRPGGRLALTVWHSTEHIPVYAAIERVIADVVGDTTFRLPPFAFDQPQELRRLAEEAGFLEVELLKETKMTRLESWSHIIDISLEAYRGLFGPVPDFDELQRGRLMVAARDALRGFADPDTGVVEFPQTAHLLIAKGPPARELPNRATIEEQVRRTVGDLFVEPSTEL